MEYGELRHKLGSTEGFETSVEGNRVTLLHDGAQGYPAMLEAIANAQHEILLEMYWFASDVTGARFADALIARARDGIRVVVVYDAIGSLEADAAQWTRMRAAGCHVFEYNPIAPWRRRFRIGVVNNRNHRKMLIVDRRIGFTGGINIGDAWAPEEQGGEGWRDDMIRVEGPAVRQMVNIFRLGVASLVMGMDGVRDTLPPGAELPEAPSRVQVIANHYFGERRAIRAAYLTRIRNARRCIYITNSYFVPDGQIRRSLAEAARRGVDVRVMVPGEGDVPAVHHASRKRYSWLDDHGIRLYEWQGVILHAKTAVVDGEWSTVGSYNLDYRSWRFNLEVVVAVEDRSVAKAVEERFLLDLENAKAFDRNEHRYRSLGDRFFENFFYLFRKLL
ncbi:MAG: phospholipase D-like domain-containing protein [Myxococcota bacterium]